MNTPLVAGPGLGLEDGLTDVGLLGPMLVSLLALVMAVGASTVPIALMQGLLGVQALLLALSAAMATSSAAVWTARWRARAAPSRGAALARRRMQMQLWLTGAVGALGLLALAVRAEVVPSLSLARVPQAMLAALTLLLAAQVLGAWCGLAWRGLAPGWVLWGWCLLGLALACLGWLRWVLVQAPWLAATALLASVALWYALSEQLGKARLKWAGIPTAPLRPPLRTALQGGTLLPFTDGVAPAVGRDPAVAGAFWRSGWAVSYVPFLMSSQVAMNPHVWAAHALDLHVQGWGVAAYPAWIVVLSWMMGGALWQPGLHWRHRLAPKSWSPRRWAARLVLCNLRFGVLWLAAVVVTVTWVSPPEQRALMAGTGLNVLGDVALACTGAALLRAWRNRPSALLLGSLAAGCLMFAALQLAVLAGYPMARGPVWVAVQLLLSVAFGIAAVQRWTRRDLNPLAEHG